MFEVGDKVTVSSEGYCGTAYIRSFYRDGAYVSVERFSKPFFVLLRALKSNREPQS